jgi:hypothetical protein
MRRIAPPAVQTGAGQRPFRPGRPSPDRYANAVGSGPGENAEPRAVDPRRPATGCVSAPPLGLDRPREPAINENRNANVGGGAAQVPEIPPL